ncbi:hypothetical protein CCMSSC00406_0006824 [Pleurotus cornucopiae]|uniref:Uncharacterized protein n=1 Tax=Pleurotus cornucopiae TaxID=5321 RepID=A0ACB7J212_PLECO|nr:hypothetical protein CCMSSC00406_0006824 [Pleurotus cornucopiae]
MSANVAASLVFERLSLYPGLLDNCSMLDIVSFIQLACHFQREISLYAAYGSPAPPPRLAKYIHRFFASYLQLSDRHVSELWDALKDMIWTHGTHDSKWLLDDNKAVMLDLLGHQAGSHPKEQLGRLRYFTPSVY